MNHHSTNTIDEPSRLGQFAWEQWEDQIIAVIFRSSSDGLRRYVLKRYAERVFFRSDRWKHLSSYFSSISTLIHAYSLTPNETALMRRIIHHHLDNKLRLCVTQSNDQLIDYEDLLEFIYRVQDLYTKNANFYNHTHLINRNITTIPEIPILPSSIIDRPTQPSISKISSLESSLRPSLSISQTAKNQVSLPIETRTSIPSEFSPISLHTAKIDGSGWIQINHVYLPFIIKKHQRLVPYPIVLSCKLLEPKELRSMLIRATLTDITLINLMIKACNKNNQPIPNNSLLINVYHILIGTQNFMYAKILPSDRPTSKINYQYKNILSLEGGSLHIASHLIPYICLGENFYVPLNEILSVYPNIYPKLKPFVRLPHVHEIDYLQLVLFYYNKATVISNDALLINIKVLDETEVTLSKLTPLIEYRTTEKIKLHEYYVLMHNQLLNKRKIQQSNKNKKSPKKLKPPNQINQSIRPVIFPITGYFPMPSTPLFCNQQNFCFS